MKTTIMLGGKEVASMATNMSLTYDEVLRIAFGLSSTENQEELEKLRKKQPEVVCYEDGEYFLPIDDFEFVED